MRVREHCDQVPPKFRGKANEPYYLGIELEVEAPDDVKREQGLELRKRPRHFYAKYDGSLNHYGWELITHPIGKSLWLERHPAERGPVHQFFQLVRDLKELGYTSHDGGRAGLHVHVSRTAFPDPLSKDNQYYWFSRLVNGPLFRKLSQRSDDCLNRWTKQIPSPERYEHVRTRGDRYHATNLTPRTCEVRIFRGNMREDRIRKAIEAVIAAVEYSWVVACWPTSDVGMDVQYTEWVQRNTYTYPNLAAYLNTLALGIAEETVPA